jgi:N-acetylglucosamine kinase-like BadF-type ATPase
VNGIFLGVDAGGSHTRAAISGPTCIEANGCAGPANWTSMGLMRCVEAIAEASEQALSSAALVPDELTHACIALAGYYPPWHEAEARESIAAALPGVSFDVVPDLVAAWAGATGGAAGIVLAVGTGAVAYGRDLYGREARAGGWGHLFGDEGGGFWIGREVLRAVSRSLDGRGPATSLVEAVRQAELKTCCDPQAVNHACAGPESDAEALRAVYRDGWSRERIAALSVAAACHAQEGDCAANQIMERAAAELGCLLEAVVRKLGGYSSPLPVWAVGGAIDSGPPLLGPLERWVAAVLPHLEWRQPLGSPLEGALRLAQRERAG